MTVKERIGTAQYSKDLGEAPSGELGDIDIIRATGMVGVSMPLGVSLWRLKVSGDAREFPKVIEGLAEMLARRRPMDIDTVKLVNQVLRHHLDDLCHACHGRGFEVVPNTPMLSDVACTSCQGQGRLQMQNADESAFWLLEQIARMEREVASAIMRKLAREMDF